MHMRLVTVEVEKDGVDLLARVYEDRVIRALSGIGGCRFAGLMQSVSRPERCLSLTLWTAPESAAAYEQSGLFAELLRESAIFFAPTTDYSIRLSQDLTVEVVPVRSEPEARSYPVAAESGPAGEEVSDAVWLRIVSLKVLPEKLEEFKRLYIGHSIPALRAAQGCRHVWLLENTQGGEEVFSVTVWDSREHAVAYEQSGTFEKLVALQRHTLSGFAGEQLLSGGAGEVHSRGTDDVVVEHFRVLAGRSFS